MLAVRLVATLAVALPRLVAYAGISPTTPKKRKQRLRGYPLRTPIVVEDALFYILYFIIVGFLGAKAPKRRERAGWGLRGGAGKLLRIVVLPRP